MKYLLLLFLILSNAALACSCVEPPPASIRSERSTAVFVGRIVSETINESVKIYRFEVKETLKGVLPKRIGVTTNKSGASCGSNFLPDTDYLVFCLGGGSETYYTSLCSANRSAHSEVGKKEIEELRSIREKSPNQTLLQTMPQRLPVRQSRGSGSTCLT